MPPVIKLPVAGSNGTCPEMKTKPLALMAWEYGPMALGAFGVETTSRVKPLMIASEKSYRRFSLINADKTNQPPREAEANQKQNQCSSVEISGQILFNLCTSW